jgi:hypothetical protein
MVPSFQAEFIILHVFEKNCSRKYMDPKRDEERK